MFYKALFKEIGDVKTFLDQEEVKLLVGQNYDHYRDLWLQHEQKLKGERKKIEVKGRINWLAFIYLPAWLGYRKMHLVYWIFVISFSALSFYEIYYDTELLKSSTPIYAFFAANAKSIYLQHIIHYAKSYKKLPNKERKIAYIKNFGGASKVLAWFYGVSYIVLIVGSGLFALYLRGEL